MAVIDIDALWHTGGKAAWNTALEGYWKQVQPSNLALEQNLDRLDIGRLHAMSPESWYIFLRDEYFRWKYTAPNRYASTTRLLRLHTGANGFEPLDMIRQRLLAINVDDIEAAMNTALSIPGLGPAGASGLLSLMFPKSFGTVDQFVVKELRLVSGLEESAALLKMRPENLKPGDAKALIEILRRKAAQNTLRFQMDWTPRKIDQVLWGYRSAT